MTHRAALARLAHGILGHRERTEDLLQDAFLRALAAAGDRVADPIAYAFRIVRNMALDACRRAALESRLFDEEAAGASVESACDSPERLAIDRQQLRMVLRALQELPERTRRIVEWCRLDGHTQREIAERLQLSPAMVHLLLRDGVARCKAVVMDATVKHTSSRPAPG